MKINEVIVEAKTGKVPGDEQRATVGLNKFTDANHWNSDYTMYRLGLAAAETDGKIKPTTDEESWVGRWKVAIPFSQADQDILDRAYEAVNAVKVDMNHGDLRSQEAPGVNKTSPLAKPKKNKYGV
jgi:hypothetical protein